MEGITFGLRDSMELIKASGIEIRQLRVNGGGARSRFWRQMIADIFGLPVVTVNSTDGPAYGAALMAASGVLGRDIPSLCGEWIDIEDLIEPDASSSQRYDAYYKIYRSLYGTLKQTMHQLTNLAARP